MGQYDTHGPLADVIAAAIITNIGLSLAETRIARMFSMVWETNIKIQTELLPLQLVSTGFLENLRIPCKPVGRLAKIIDEVNRTVDVVTYQARNLPVWTQRIIESSTSNDLCHDKNVHSPIANFSCAGLSTVSCLSCFPATYHCS